MNTQKFVLLVVLSLVLSATAWAQEPLSPESKERIVGHLRSLIGGSDVSRFDPLDPVRIEMLVWGNDAITNKIREVPSEKVIYLYGDHGRIGTRDRAFLPSGELSELVINHDFAINSETTWRHSRDSIEIGDPSGEQRRMIVKLLEIEFYTIRRMLRQGLPISPDKEWKYESIEGTSEAWQSVWHAPDLKLRMRVDGIGTDPEEIRVLSISHAVDAESDAEGHRWSVAYKLGRHQAIQWRTGQMSWQMEYLQDGRPVNRFEITSLKLIERSEFADAVSTPNPNGVRLPENASSLVDSRGLHTTQWIQDGDRVIKGDSQLNRRRVLVISSVCAAAVGGVAIALLFWRRTR